MSKKSTTAPAQAGQAEAQGIETATVTWGALTPFEIPRNRDDWPFTAVVAAEQESWPMLVAELVPADTLAEIRRLRLRKSEVMDLLNAMSDALGFEEPGE